MVKKATKKKATTSRAKKKKADKNRGLMMGIGLALLLFGFFGLFKLGIFGTLMANVYRFFVGDIYPVLAILLMIYGVLLLIYGKEPEINWHSPILKSLIAIAGVLLFCHCLLFRSQDGATAGNYLGMTWKILLGDIKGGVVSKSVGGGMIGGLLYTLSHLLVSQVGSYIISVLLIFFGLFLTFGWQWSRLAEGIQDFIGEHKEKRQASKEKQENVKISKNKEAVDSIKQKAEEQRRRDQLRENQVRSLSDGEALAQEEADHFPEMEESRQLELEIDGFGTRQITQKSSIKEVSQDDNDGDLEFEIPQESEDRDYQLPSSSLLNEIPITDQSNEYQTIEKNVGVLERTFASFGVDAKVVKASLGPSVTKFEIQPAVGVKVSKVVSLTDDIALALAAKDIRMEAPIPGKSLIGIEVPNQTVSTVSFRDIIEGQHPHPDKLLEVPLGRDISGNIITADLAKMPHLLVAGSTGSGKSVCINGIITSILMQAKPHEVKLMMVDPKKVELNVYNGIPHLLTPVVTNPRKASQALHKVVEEMEKRYELFAASGARNITGYNDLIIRHNLEDGEDRPILPFIVVIVDELADLMMVASNEVEDAITRLAQMARAAGIHMILATQRPSVDVITGIIKANVPSRIAFAVSSGTDSRTIIDSNGAEKLLGRGDMLFLPMGENKPVRVQGAFISDEEVEKVVSFVKEQQGADYQENMMPTDEPTASSGGSQDELYNEALALVVEMQTASVSLLQRRFRIGYNRAARIIDELEMNGAIGPSEGSKPRKVLVESLDEISSEADDAPVQQHLPFDEEL